MDAPIFVSLVLLLRVLLASVAAYNVCWSMRWVPTLIRGEHFPLSLLKTAIFLMSGGILALQIVVLGGADEGASTGWAFFGFLSIFAGQFLLALAHWSGWVAHVVDLTERSRKIDELLAVVGIIDGE